MSEHWQWGDAVSKVATPMARVMGMDCIDPETREVRPESGCGKRINALNRFGTAMYDSFWPSKDEDSG